MAPSKAPILIGSFVIAALAVLAVAIGQTSEGDDGAVAVKTHQALQSLREGDFDDAENAGKLLAARSDANAWRGWAIVASARQHQKDYIGAIQAYKSFLAACPSADLRQFALDQIDVCDSATHAGAAKCPAPATPSKALTEADLNELAVVSDETFTETSDHFVVQARNQRLAKLLVKECERSLSRICRRVMAGQEFPHSVTVAVWKDAKEFAAHATAAPEGSSGVYSVTTINGVANRRIDLTQLDAKGLFDVTMLDRALPHEMSHLVTGDFFGDAACPLFLNEGLAMMSEYQVDNRRVLLAGVALAGQKKLSLESLLTRQRDNMGEPAVFYAESFSLVEFLHSRLTQRQFRDYLEHTKSGCTMADSLQRALYVADDATFLPALSRAWEDRTVANAQILKALSGHEDAALTSAE